MNTIEVKYRVGDVVVLQVGMQCPQVCVVDTIIAKKETTKYHLRDSSGRGQDCHFIADLMSPGEWLAWKLEQLKRETASAFATYQTLVRDAESLERRVKEKGQ